MDAILLIDFGSTYTKLTAVSPNNSCILATAKSLTTAESNVMVGYLKAVTYLKESLGKPDLTFLETYACSSAAGGLSMVAVGLVPDLTAEAARKAALGAGAKVVAAYSYELTLDDMNELLKKKPDIILLTGGTDGGNKTCLLHNARMIAQYASHIPVIVAGNKAGRTQIEELFKRYHMHFKMTENVLPTLFQLNIEPAQKAIRDMYIEKIVHSKGLEEIMSFTSGSIIPTPTSVLSAAKLLADGTPTKQGLGELLVIDVGGATTDVHSISKGEAKKHGTVQSGIPEPYAKRTVEGDLGTRVGAISLFEAVGERPFDQWAPSWAGQVLERCEYLQNHVDIIPITDEEKEFDEALGTAAIELAIERHVGTIETVYTQSGLINHQRGKDLSSVSYIIGTGGGLIYSRKPTQLLERAVFEKHTPQFLKPVKPEMLIDQTYVMSAMGLLANHYPEVSLDIMKSKLNPIHERSL